MNQEKLTQEAEASNASNLENQVVQPIITQEGNNEGSDPFAKGRERISAMSDLIKKAKEKTKSAISSVGSKISRFWSRTKSTASEGAAAVLSADVLAAKGYNAVENKVKDVNEKINEKVEEGGQYVGYQTARAAEFVGGKVEQVDDFIDEKMDQFGDFAELSYEKAVNFKNTKAEQIKVLGVKSAELTKDVAFYAQAKTVEGLEVVKGGIKNGFNSLKEFGENAMASARIETARAKEAYREKMNSIRMNRLQAEFKKASQWESAAANQTENLRMYRESLAEKISLLNGAESVSE